MKNETTLLGIPWLSSGYDLVFRAGVWSLMGELRSHKLLAWQNKKSNNKNTLFKLKCISLESTGILKMKIKIMYNTR